MSETKPQSQSKVVAQCVGRFNFSLPAGVLPQGREQRIYTVKAWSEAIAPGTDPTQAWAKRLAPFREPAPSESAPTFLREFNLAGVGHAAWYRPLAMYQDDLKILAMNSRPGLVLFLETDASAGRDYESIAEQGIARLAESFIAGSADGFCIEHGAFVIRPSKNELTSAGFSGGGVEVDVHTETVGPPSNSDGFNLDTKEVKTLKRSSRNVSGLSGVEDRVRITEQDKAPSLVYSWRYPGKSADGLHPYIYLQASAEVDHADMLEAVWEQLLVSWQQRPTGVR
jgi:hypothetical protein